MNKTGSAAKVKLNSFDDLFGDGQPQAGIEQVQEIALSELHEFKGHPFKVLDDEKMQETVESVREHGVLMPGIARPRAEGGYEIIAGHRRRHACELVGLDTMPMFIRNYTDDEATIIMVDSNIQSFYICFMIRILHTRLRLIATAMTMESIFDIDSETSRDTGIV